MTIQEYETARSQCPEAIILFCHGGHVDAYSSDARYLDDNCGDAIGDAGGCISPDDRLGVVVRFPQDILEPIIAELVHLGRRVAVCEKVA